MLLLGFLSAMALRSAICTLAIAGVAQSFGQRLVGRAEKSTSTGYDFVDPLIGTDNGGTIIALPTSCDLAHIFQGMCLLEPPCLSVSSSGPILAGQDNTGAG